MTLKKVKVNLAKAFEPSQVYVACKYSHDHGSTSLISITVSRATSLEGLEVTELPKKVFGGANPEVTEFLASFA
jgi:hypothetical protein